MPDNRIEGKTRDVYQTEIGAISSHPTANTFSGYDNKNRVEGLYRTMNRVFFIIISCLVVLMPATFGLYLLLSSPARLISIAKRNIFLKIIKFPKEGTTSWRYMILFYRLIGALALTMSIIFLVIFITQINK